MAFHHSLAEDLSFRGYGSSAESCSVWRLDLFQDFTLPLRPRVSIRLKPYVSNNIQTAFMNYFKLLSEVVPHLDPILIGEVLVVNVSVYLFLIARFKKNGS